MSFSVLQYNYQQTEKPYPQVGLSIVQFVPHTTIVWTYHYY